MLFNIARNGAGNQMGNTQMVQDALPDFSGADGCGGQIKCRKPPAGYARELKSSRIACRSGASSYRNYSDAHYLMPFVPRGQGLRLVSAHDKVKLGARVLPLQFAQGIDGVGRARPADLAVIHQHTRQFPKSQLGHGKAVRRRGKRARLVPGLPRGKHPHYIQPELRDSSIDQRHVGIVRRVKRSAEDTDTPGWLRQTHSLRTRNFLYRSSSGEPLRVLRW